MTSDSTVYVRLIDEAVDVWRPVEAVDLTETTCRIADQPYDREIETWEFEPGVAVSWRWTGLSHGTVRVATAPVED